MAKIELNIAGMTCGGCAKSITSALQNCVGVEQVKVDHVAGIAQIVFDSAQTNAQELKTVVEDAGFDVLN